MSPMSPTTRCSAFPAGAARCWREYGRAYSFAPPGRASFGMPAVSTPAVVLSTGRYSETSKIVRRATRESGAQSALAKGALRPRSRVGAALQLLSAGMAHLIVPERRDLQLLTAFDVARVPVGLAADLDRYAPASA